MNEFIETWGLEQAWKNMLYEIYYNGFDLEKDDAPIREQLGWFYRIRNPMLDLGFSFSNPSKKFRDWAANGTFDIDGYPMKGQALADYIISLDDDDFIYPNGNDSFVYTYPERLQAIWVCDEDGKANFWNQIDVMIERLQKNMGSNRAVATLYQVGLDGDRIDIPCLNWLQFTVRDNKLTLHVMFRSNDIYGAWPSNMYFLTYLGLKVQERLNILDPTIIFNDICYHVSSAHIYHTDMDAVKKILRG